MTEFKPMINIGDYHVCEVCQRPKIKDDHPLCHIRNELERIANALEFLADKKR